MAKSVSIIKLRGTVDGLTFVRSRTYGDHVRTKRGTYKEAEVNDTLKQEIKNLISANVPAKIFKDAIDPYRGELMGGQLWQRLLSMFRKQLKEHGAFDFSKLPQFEIHTGYPFQRFLDVQPFIKSGKKKSVLDIRIAYDHHPGFTKTKYIDGYRLTVLGIFPDLKKKNAKTASVTSKTLELTGTLSPLITQLIVPFKATCYIICVKIEGCTQGVVSSTRTTQGMSVVGAGQI